MLVPATADHPFSNWILNSFESVTTQTQIVLLFTLLMLPKRLHTVTHVITARTAQQDPVRNVCSQKPYADSEDTASKGYVDRWKTWVASHQDCPEQAVLEGQVIHTQSAGAAMQSKYTCAKVAHKATVKTPAMYPQVRSTEAELQEMP